MSSPKTFDYTVTTNLEGFIRIHVIQPLTSCQQVVIQSSSQQMQFVEMRMVMYLLQHVMQNSLKIISSWNAYKILLFVLDSKASQIYFLLSSSIYYILIEADIQEVIFFGFVFQIIKIVKLGIYLVVQWLRRHTPNAGDTGLVPGHGTRSHMLQTRICMLQLKILHAAMKIKNRACHN